MILRLVPPIELLAVNFEPIYYLFAFTHFHINVLKGLTQRLNDVCINEISQTNQILAFLACCAIAVSQLRPPGLMGQFLHGFNISPFALSQELVEWSKGKLRIWATTRQDLTPKFTNPSPYT